MRRERGAENDTYSNVSIERATEQKSDRKEKDKSGTVSKVRHERATKLPKIELYSIDSTKFFSIDNTYLIQKKLK